MEPTAMKTQGTHPAKNILFRNRNQFFCFSLRALVAPVKSLFLWVGYGGSGNLEFGSHIGTGRCSVESYPFWKGSTFSLPPFADMLFFN